MIICTLLGAVAGGVSAAELDYDSLIQDALRQRNGGNFTESEATLEQARPLARETNEVDFLLAMVIAFQERYLEANQILDAALQRYPDDIQLVLGKARVLSYQGFYGEATSMADRALALNPDSLDALNLKARISYYQRRYSNARAVFRQVLALDPVNLEALVGLYDTEMAAGDDAAAEQSLATAVTVAPGHIDVVSRQQQAAQPVVAVHELLTSITRSNLDQSGLANWYDRSLEYRYRDGFGNQLFLRSDHAQRFGLHDTLIEAGAVISGPRRTYNFALAYTPDDEILPEYRMRLGAGFMLNQATDNFGSTMLDLTATHAKYSTGDVQILNIDFTHYLLTTNAWINPGLILVRDENGNRDNGWRIGAHWQTNERLLLGLNYTDAAETEINVTTQTQAQHVYMQYDWTDRLSVRLDLSHNRRENSYTRDSVAIGLRWRF